MTEAAETEPRPGAERRRHERFVLHQPVRVLHGETCHEGMLCDISLGGALAAVAAEIPQGDSVILETEGFGILPGIVVRTAEPDLVGICFVLEDDVAKAFQKILIDVFLGTQPPENPSEIPVEKHPDVP